MMRSQAEYVAMDRVDNDDQPTCGKGLAANAALPAKLAELTAAQAEVLERHTRALDGGDPNTERELQAYTQLAVDYRGVSHQLANLAQRMLSYRELPMAPHNPDVMTDPEGQAEAFQRFVALERELLGLLESRVQAEQALVT